MNDATDPQEPRVSDEQVQAAADLLRQARSADPLRSEGTVSDCPACHQPTLVATNRLTERVPTRHGLVLVTRLAGAQCTTCGHRALDASSAGIVQEVRQEELVADYETRVSRSGKVPAVLLKEDLRRVLRIGVRDCIRWTVLDRDHAYVTIERHADEPA